MSSAQIFTDGNFQGVGNDGLAVPNGKLYIYNNATGLLATTYQDSAQTITNVNPVILSASGKAKVFLSAGTYDITLKTSADVTVWTLNDYIADDVYSKAESDAILSARTVGTIAALRTTVYSGQPFVSVTGYYTASDNIGVREYYWDATSTEADNGGTIIQVTGVTTGRWKMKYSGAVNVKWFGAKGDGVTDDSIALQAVINFADSEAYFPKGTYVSSTGLVIPTTNSLKISGDGAQSSTILFINAGTGNNISSTSSSFIEFESIGISYNNALFTGALVKLLNGSRIGISNVEFLGDGVTSASYLLDLNESIEVVCKRSRFSGAQYLVRGQNENGLGFANAVSFIGCDFDRYVTAAIRNVGQGWSVTGNAFEGAADGGGRAIAQEATIPAMGFTFSGNWLGDATANLSYTWIVINGTGINITGNYVNGHGYLLSSAIAINAATSGLTVKGNRFSSFAVGIQLGTGIVSNSDITGNSYPGTINETAGTLGDDVLTYDEGDWTPDLRFGGLATGITYGQRVGKYKKIGKCVHITYDFTLTSKGTATGGGAIYGLPFTARPEIGTSIDVGMYINMSAAVTFMNRIEDSNTIISLGQPTGTTTQPVNDTAFTNTTRLAGSGFYFTV